MKGKAPWEWNPGRQVYPEDIAAVKKMDEFYHDKQRMESEKKAKKKGGGGGPKMARKH